MESLAKVLTSPEAATTVAPPSEDEKHLQTDKAAEDTNSTRPSTSKSKEEVAIQDEAPAGASGSTPGDDNVEYLTGIRLYSIIACITLMCFLMLLDTSIVATAIPVITNEFHSLQDVGWYGSAYQLASAALQPLTGKIYNKFNAKWTLLSFFFLFELGSLICGLAQSSTVLIVGRAIAGMGGAGLMNGSLTIIAGAVPLHKQPILMGVLMGFAQLGIVTGPLIGGAFTQYSTWRWCFYLNLPIGGVVLAGMAFIRVPESVAKAPPLSVLPTLHRDLDLVGFALLAPSAIQLLLALQWGGNEYAWNSATIIGLFCGAGGTAIVWGVWNWRRGDDALLPFPMIMRRAVWSSCVVGMAIYVVVMLTSYFNPIYFQSVKGATPSESGVDVLPSILGQLVFAVLVGVLSSKTGYVIPYSAAAAVIMAIGAGLNSRFGPDTVTAEWAGVQFLSGVGRGLGMQMPMIAIQTVLAPGEISVAMAILMFSQFMASSIALSIGNTIFNQSLRSELASQVPHANINAIIAAGATAFRKVVSPEDLPSVIAVYATSIDRVFYLVASVSAASFFGAWFLGWVDIRKKKAPAAGEEQA